MVTKTDRKIIYTRIDRQLWAEVKAHAAKKEMTIQDFVAEILAKAVQ